MTEQVLHSSPTRPASTLRVPPFQMPAGAWDSHVHVFGSEHLYPRVDQPHYTLPDGPTDKLLAMAAQLGIGKLVIVQPSFYGTDNRCMLDALGALGDRARGVAMVDDAIADEQLHAMDRAGVRALRLDLFLRASMSLDEKKAYVTRCARRVKPLGWHLQFYTPGRVVQELLPVFAELDIDFVIDHMGYMLESDGWGRHDFDRLLATLRNGRGWLKISAPYRLAKDGNFEKLRPLAHALVHALPDRVIWGSDWPHIPDGSRDTGELLALLGDWFPDADVRDRILVENPSRLFSEHR